MVSLSTTVARHRVFYPRPIPAMPDILMIALPPEFRDAPSALGRHYPILIETIEPASDRLLAEAGGPAAPPHIGA